MLTDFHMHSEFSTDSETPVTAMIESAIKKGLPTICLTDHQDWDFPIPETPFTFDTDAYFVALRPLQQKYAEKIDLRIGVELGLQPHLKERYDAYTKKYPFDFIIGSSHLVHGMDPYNRKFWVDRDESAACLEYFEATLANIQIFDCFDVYGHIDYVVRYGPTKNEHYSYQKYADVLDAILKALLEKGKGIEVNTAGYKYGLGVPNPCPEILKRYKELGGEIITLGADAHVPEHVAYDFAKAAELLKSLGYRYYTIFRERKPEFVKL